MKKQTRSKIARLIEQYPGIGEIRSVFKEEDGTYPDTSIFVQRPDREFMYFRGRTTGNGSYLMREDGLRGDRWADTLWAFAPYDQLLPGGRIHWGIPGDKDLLVEDIFRLVYPEVVSYLVRMTFTIWYEPPSSEEEGLGKIFGNKKGEELIFVVYPRPKNKNWQELIEEADRLKVERENAYQNPPKVQHRLPAVHQAFREGYRLHAFLSGGGLRVLTLTKGKKEFYGEHPNIEEALVHLNEDYLAGGIPYDEVYSSQGRHTHYLTGSSLATSNIDYWVLQGQKVDCWQEGNQVVCQLSGYTHQEIPPEILVEAKALPGKKFWWRSRGYNFCCIYYEHLFANGDPGHRFWIVRKPKHDPEGSDAIFYPITKTGRGNSLWKAMLEALRAQEVGVIPAK